jgi:translation initiation factor 2B subunit (eIF-2B alpha/beta/delta family)
MVFLKIDALVDEIKNDNLSGSSILAFRAAECLDAFAEEVAQNHSDFSPDDYLNELLSLGKRLISAQPTMAAVLNCVNEIITSVLKNNDFSNKGLAFSQKKQLQYLCTNTQVVSRKFILDLKLAQETIANSYTEILKNNDTVMTISSSGSVEMLLATGYENSLELTVFVPESRPMFEGRLLAQRLANRGINCVLIADHAMFHYLDGCSKVIVGADRVIPAGILNKIGTYGLALAAHEKKVPFYCACECFKLVPDIIPLEKLNPQHPESQLYYISKDDEKPETLEVKNIYFDFTPLKFISNFLTDCGMMDGKQLKDYIDNVKILPELMEKFN